MKKRFQGTVNLPGSKSESNRALMIAAYGGFTLDAENLSDAHDTVLLQSLLEQVERHALPETFTVDSEDAGTVSRFMMPYLACKPGTWLLRGTKRLCERPMAPLIGALRQLGAEVECLETEGCLPVRIRGKQLKGGRLNLDASQSSQFVTALLLAAPTWDEGLQLTLTDDTVSEPYIGMTCSMMEYFGVHVVRDNNVITVTHQPYRQRLFVVEADWSAASYWYEMLALSDGGKLLLKGLKPDSLQGDAVVADFFKPLGVNTEYLDDGIRITSIGTVKPSEKPLQFDFCDTPDLFPSVLVSCVALHIKAEFNNIMTLYHKESDRVNSLLFELSKIYTFINIVSNNKLIIEKSSLSNSIFDDKKLSFRTYDDHRVAMSLAGLTMKLGQISLDFPEVVNKSFPTFWDEFRKIFKT